MALDRWRRLAGLIARASVPRLTRALAPTWVLLFLAISQADAITDWDLVREQLAAAPLTQRALAGALFLAAWTSSTGPAVRVATRTPADRWRYRLPCTSLDLAIGLAPVWMLAVLPLLWFGDVGAFGPALAATAVHPTLAWASQRRGEALLGLLAAPILLALCAAVPAAPLVAAAGALRGARVLQASPPATTRPVRSRLRMNGPLSALWWRDLLALWRLERSVVLGALFVSAPAYAVQSTAVANYPLVGESTVTCGLLVLTLTATVAASGVLALPERLGRAFDPRRAPISAPVRAALLGTVGLTLAVPSWLAVLLAGSEGPWRLAAHLVALVAGAAWFGVGLGKRTDADRASFVWWVLALSLLSFAPSPWQPLGALLLASCAWFGASQTLAHARRRP